MSHVQVNIQLCILHPQVNVVGLDPQLQGCDLFRTVQPGLLSSMLGYRLG